jgi:hypothetical protein
MNDDTKIQRVRQGHQPTKNQLTRGYRPTQPVDLSNLKIPKNLGDAAVAPRNSGTPTSAPVEPKEK